MLHIYTYVCMYRYIKCVCVYIWYKTIVGMRGKFSVPGSKKIILFSENTNNIIANSRSHRRSKA